MADTKYSVSWDAYQTNICNGLSSLQQRGEFVDMTLAAEGHHVKVHQMVLSLVSPYIKDLIISAACPHPVIFLNQVSYQTLQSILQYAYTGEVLVPYDKLQDFLNACKHLYIRGFEHMESTKQKIAVESTNTAPVNDGISVSTRHVNANTKDKDSAKTTIYDPFDSASADCTYANDDDDDDDDDMFVNKEELDNTVKSLEEQKKSVLDTAETLKFTISCMGSPQLVLNRYMYNLRSTRKNGENMWRCIHLQRQKCRAFIVVKGSEVLRRACAHNHPFHDKQILKRLRERKMFSTMNEVQSATILKKKEIQARQDNKKATAKQKDVHAPFLCDETVSNDGETKSKEAPEY